MKLHALLAIAALALVACERRDGKIIIDETEVKQKAQQGAEKVGEGAEKAADKAEELGKKAVEGAKELGRDVDEAVETRPEGPEHRAVPNAPKQGAPKGVGGGPAHDAGAH